MLTYLQAVKYLYHFIPDRESLKYSGINGVLRTKFLLKLLDNPQEKIRVIHIAGTSGKGSTAYLTSILLKDHGFKVGLQVSPHLLDLRERLQINNALISKEDFCQILNEIIPSIEKAKETEWGKLTFFEILVCLTFYYFAKRKVDFAVMETGLGGIYDGTNVVENPSKIVILTRMGFDHQWILGNTLSAITEQKAGIIKGGNKVITLNQGESAMRIIEKKVSKERGELHVITKNKNYKNVEVTFNSTTFDFGFEDLVLKNIELNLIGFYQAENCALALTVLYLLGKEYGFKLSETQIRKALRAAIFHGRFESFLIGGGRVIVDGAHNPQKMRALTATLNHLYPGIKLNFLIAFKKEKDYKNMLKYIVEKAQTITLSDFSLEGQDLRHLSENPEKLKEILNQLKFYRYKIVKNNKRLIEDEIISSKKPLIITGSLYFIASIYSVLQKVNINRQL